MRPLFSIAVCVLLVGCSECAVTDAHDYTSPDAQRVLTVYAYTCHDTTGLNWYADLHPVGTRLHHPGNVMAFGLGDMVSQVTVTWQSSTQLALGYPFDGQRVPASTNVDGVMVSFVTAADIAENQRQ